MTHTRETTSASELLKLLIGVGLVFGLFHGLAGSLGSDRGQTGLVVGVVVVAAMVAVEWLLHGNGGLSALRALGLGVPRLTGVVAAGGITIILLLTIPIFLRSSGASMALAPGWASLVPGLFAQAGVAEETLFRGYLFRHLRAARSFWSAAWLSMLPFVCIHLILFWTMPWPVALAAVGVSVMLSFPFAHLFELGGNTIWAPALLHFIIQGTVKVIVLTGASASSFPLVWMAASALMPWTALLVRPEQARG